MGCRQKGGVWAGGLAVAFIWPLPFAMGESVAVRTPSLRVDKFLSVSDAARAENSAARTAPSLIVAESAPLQLHLSKSIPDPKLQLAQAATSPPADDAVPASGAPRFDIRGYQVDGNTLLQPEEINQVLAPFTGKRKDFGDVQRALEALQQVYQQRGYVSVQVTLPEQELEKGEVRFLVTEFRIGKITVEGNEYFSNDNIRRSVPTLVPGQTPNAREIAANLKVVNESPAKQATVLLKSGESENEVDANIRVADVDPKRYSISLDNTGNTETGKYRASFAFQNANLWDRDHVLTAQYTTSPENPSKVTSLGVGYRIPFYARGDSLDLVGGYSNVDSGRVQNLFDITGQGAVYAVRYNHSLPKWGEIEQKITYGLDYRAYQNNVLPIDTSQNIVPDITIHPLGLTYSGILRQPQRELTYYVQVSQNIPGGNDGTDRDFKNARAGARAAYRILRAGGTLSGTTTGDWQYRINLLAQHTGDALVAGEQFGLGGADSIRGFNERYIAKDRGHRANFELYSPDVGSKLGMNNTRLRLVTFYDTGTVSNNQLQLGELSSSALDSVGIGVRLNYGNYLIVKLDYAQVLHDGTQFESPDGRTHANSLHVSIASVF